MFINKGARADTFLSSKPHFKDSAFMFLGEVSSPPILISGEWCLYSTPIYMQTWPSSMVPPLTLPSCQGYVLARRVSSRPMDTHFWKKYKENSLNLLSSFWTASFQCLAKSLLPALLPAHPTSKLVLRVL